MDQAFKQFQSYQAADHERAQKLKQAEERHLLEQQQ
jgi:hypothetical protein